MIGAIINDRYHLNAELGQGGMGTVYLAHDSVLEREVAIKLVSGTRLGTEGRSRLLVEAQTVAKLKHLNIVTVYDAGEFEDQPYVVMEYIQGVTLNEYEPDGLERIIEIARQICAALQHAHEQCIVHRDLKPENVIIEPDGSVRLMDFGLALSTATRMTEEGMITGTVFYMSPEQAFGYEITPQSDLYSLGIILYELTTKRLPFEAADALAVITQHIHAPVVPPRAQNEQIPIPLNDLILSLLSKEPNERPTSAAEVSSLLEEARLVKTDETSIQELHVLDRIVRGRIVGRQKEFAEARDLWNKATTGQGQVLLISGEPGIGKTRLMREVITHAEVSGGKALIGDCYAEGNAPYNTFSQIIRQALNRFSRNGLEFPDSVLDDLLKLIPDQLYQYPQVHPNPNLDPETEQQRLFENMVTFCNLLSDESPLLLVVEDVHWGDSGTMKMLHHLIRRTQKQPVMILVTYREVELKKSRPFNEMLLELNRQRLGRRMKLDRLGREQTREMLAAIFAEHITPEFLDGIYRETDGNPFFIEEVCRALVESGALYFEDGQWHGPEDMAELEIPQGVQIAVETRLSQLPPEHQEILCMASILGREFDYEILLAALDLDEDTLIEALEAVEEAQMIQELGVKGEVRFTFVHALVPSAIVESVRVLRRRKLHRHAAAAIQKVNPADFEALAYHNSEAGDDEQAYRYYVKAGERALAAFANQDAERYFLSALDLVEEMRDEADLRLVLGISLTYQGNYQQALRTWRKAIDLYQEMGEIDKVAELYSRSARTVWDDGDTIAGLEICHQGLSAIGGAADGPGFARLLSETCRAYYFNGLHEDSSKYGQEALQMGERLSLPRIQADALTSLGMLHYQSPDKPIELLERATEIAEANNLLRAAQRAHNNLCRLCTFSIGNIPKSTYHLQRAIEISQEVGDLEYNLFLRTNLLYNLTHQGMLKEAAGNLSDLQELRDSLPGLGFGGKNLYQWEFVLLTYQGHFDRVLELIQGRIDEGRRVGDLQELETSYFTITQIYLITGELDLGKSAAEDLIELADKDMASKSVSRSLLSRIYSRRGEIQSARDLLNLARRQGEISQTHYYDQVFLLWAQADLHVAEKNWDEAWLAFEELVRITAEKDFRWFSRRAYVDWAEAHLARGQPEDIESAREMLKEAQSEFQDMGADGFVQRVADQLANIK